MWNQFITSLRSTSFFKRFKSMAESLSLHEKRKADILEVEVPSKVSKKEKKKKQKEHVAQLGKSEGFKRKIALLASYNGSGYYGVQVNGDFPTIEKDLFSALVSVGAIPEEHAQTPSKMWFQRGSRTDKGVSAVGQTFSLKAVLIPDFVNKVNESLPQKIRVMGYIRTTNGFDSKNFCCGRTYTYMTPTFAFAPIEKFITDDYRVDLAAIDRVREILKRFVGTHNFHNFTSGVKYEQDSAKRYITGFECSDPYVRQGIEFVTITVKGQSFMLHQIRKMIGLTIAIVRGYCGELTLDKSWGPEKVDVPKAPGLGLVLEELHFDGYNKKFGKDGIHEPLDWAPFREEMAKFKEDYIISDIVSQEKETRSMFNWMRTLQYHSFGEPRLEGPEKPWSYAFKTILAKDKNPPTETSKTSGSSQNGSQESSQDTSEQVQHITPQVASAEGGSFVVDSEDVNAEEKPFGKSDDVNFSVSDPEKVLNSAQCSELSTPSVNHGNEGDSSLHQNVASHENSIATPEVKEDVS